MSCYERAVTGSSEMSAAVGCGVFSAAVAFMFLFEMVGIGRVVCGFLFNAFVAMVGVPLGTGLGLSSPRHAAVQGRVVEFKPISLTKFSRGLVFNR